MTDRPKRPRDTNQLAHLRRFNRLTNGFSKNVENHMHAVALHFI